MDEESGAMLAIEMLERVELRGAEDAARFLTAYNWVVQQAENAEQLDMEFPEPEPAFMGGL